MVDLTNIPIRFSMSRTIELRQINLALQEIEDAITAAGGAPAWGDITGTLADQTDLQAELDAKAASGHTHTLSEITDSGAAAALGATGSDANAVSGTAGVDGNLLAWNADGDAVDSGSAPGSFATAAQGAKADSAAQPGDVTSITAAWTFSAPVTIGSYIDFTPGTGPAHSEGRLWYDSGAKAMSYYNEEADVTVNLGQEVLIRVRNVTGATITNGSAVYISGATGASLPNIALAQADTLATSEVVGLATHDIENNSNGYVTVTGEVNDLDTSAWSAGAELFLSDSVAGELTSTVPTTGFAKVVGYVTSSNVSVGSIKVIVSDPARRGDLTSASQNETIPGNWTFNNALGVDGGTITGTKISNWDTAFGWGDHASAGYLTTVTVGDISGVSTDVLIGRGTAGTGAAEEIAVGSGLELLGTTLKLPGNIGSFNSSISGLDAADYAIAFWDNVNNQFFSLSSFGATYRMLGADGSGNLAFFGPGTWAKNSLQESSGQLELDGDAASPGADRYYGTNGSGTKGWNPITDVALPVIANVSPLGTGAGTTTVTDAQSGNCYYATTASPNTRNIRLDSASVGTQVEVHLNGTGTCQFTQGASQTIIQGATVGIKDGSAMVAKCVATNTWSVVGGAA